MQKHQEEQLDGEDFFIDIELVKNNNVNLFDIRCPICLNVYRDPISCDYCMNHFCRRCHQQKYSLKCPLCNNISETRKAFPLLRQILSELKIKCLNFSKGCTEITDYDAYDKHMKQCEYSDQVCGLVEGKQKCNIVKLKKDMEYHRQYECNYRQCECSHCSQLFPYLQLQMHEYRCEEAITECPKCLKPIKIKDKQNHLQICDHNIEKCVYCQREYIVRELQIHQSECPLRPVFCVGCSEQFTLSVYYMHQIKCPKFPIICPQCDKKMFRQDFVNHTFKECLIYVKQTFQEEIDHLKKSNTLLENKLLQKKQEPRFSSRFKDSDIFLNQDKTVAIVREQKSKRKDRFVLFNQPLKHLDTWKFKCTLVQSNWYAVGIAELSGLYQAKKYQNIGHGSYLISSNGIMYNHHKAEQNWKQCDIRIGANDIIEITLDLNEGILLFNNLTQNLSQEMDVDIGEKDFYGCACLRVSGDEIQIIK